MKTKTPLLQHRKTRQTQPRKPELKLPFIEHFYELRHRLVRIAMSVLVFGAVGYLFQQKLVNLLLKPSHGQQFIYTSPIGGLNFLFQVCVYFGIVLSIPVIVYQLLKYLEPLLHEYTKSLIIKYSIASGALAAFGGVFGYSLGLPVALRFLSHQFINPQIKPLLTIQEYMSFVTVYLLGSALLFQIPLIIMFINRIKPLNPAKLIKFEKYMLLMAFVAAAIMTPTTNIVDQLIFTVPILVMYQVAIALVYLKNRTKVYRPSAKVSQLMQHDEAVQSQRASLNPIKVMADVRLPEARVNLAPVNKAPVLSGKISDTVITGNYLRRPMAGDGYVRRPTIWDVAPRSQSPKSLLPAS